jgi:hypothetical protein
VEPEAATTAPQMIDPESNTHDENGEVMMDVSVYTMDGSLVLARAGLELWFRHDHTTVDMTCAAHFLVDDPPEGPVARAPVQLEQYWGNRLSMCFNTYEDDWTAPLISFQLTSEASSALFRRV